MPTKFICVLLVLLLMLSAAQARTRDELRASWQEIAALRSDASPYLEMPDPETFFPGILTDDAQRDALNCLNFIRRIAGVEEVQLNPLYSLRAQNGALLLAANDSLDHNAPQPAGMSEALYESAHMGTSLGNIAQFNWMTPDILIDGITYFARDDGESNLSVLGHRRWMLNPLMAQTGFGLANSTSGMSYVSMYAVDASNSQAQWDYVAWPAEGAFPVEMMRAQLPWSISLNDALHDISASDIEIYMREENSGAEFYLRPDRENADGYCTISREACGSGSCIIFRPDIAGKGIEEYVQNQIWTISVSGLKDTNDKDISIRYNAEMVSLYPQEVANVEISQLEACLSPGESLQLFADVIPSYADDLSISWESSDTSVATVGQSGMVLAIGPGECEITASSSNGRSDCCMLIVN